LLAFTIAWYYCKAKNICFAPYCYQGKESFFISFYTCRREASYRSIALSTRKRTCPVALYSHTLLVCGASTALLRCLVFSANVVWNDVGALRILLRSNPSQVYVLIYPPGWVRLACRAKRLLGLFLLIFLFSKRFPSTHRWV